jgi:CDP-diacylglycerol--glycerol-3-phosphate 3-phosphatidyltransferase
MRLADKFTLVRIIFAPVFFGSYLAVMNLERTAAAAVLITLTALLIFAELTDYLDGSTARRLNQVSDTGKILDPFADALLHITIFFCFVISGDMNALVFMLIFYREFGMLFLRLYATKKGFDIAARMGGKIKTVLYISSCFWTLALKIYALTGFGSGFPFDRFLPLIAAALFIVCAAASYISFVEYGYRWITKKSA